MKRADMELIREPSPRDLQKKKGFLRFMELIDRDSSKFFKAGILAFISLLPYVAALIAAVGMGYTVALLACIPLGMLAMPQICGVADTVMRSLRDEVGWWWWDTYKTAWKRNWKDTLLPGAVFGFVTGVQILCVYLIAGLENPVKEFWLLVGGSLVELALTGYYLPMLVCMDLPAPALLRNCFVMLLCHPIRSLEAGLVNILYYGIVLMWFPLTSIILLLASVWLPMLISCCILYPALDKQFGLTEIYENLRKAQWEGTE